MRIAPATQRTRRLVRVCLVAATIGASAVAGGCQTSAARLKPRERVLFDSLVGAYEALFDSAGPNLGYDRSACLYMRGTAELGADVKHRVAVLAERSVLKRKSAEDWNRVDSLLVGSHDVASPEWCKQVDSSWYAMLSRRGGQR